LTPSIVFKGDAPMMAIGTPKGDNQDQTILQALLSVVRLLGRLVSEPARCLRTARVQTLHFHGSFWPHTAGFNKLNVEAAVPDTVYNELKARGHDVSRRGLSGCPAAPPP
jgi:gamma-glutamyltranspeptidase / glutathione hydrolase